MLSQFIQHIREKNLLDVGRKYLLAASGGLDSTVLAHLLHRAGISFAIAHCNFGLRGGESDGDEQFVQELARRLEVQVYIKSFETKSYGEAKGISTQMAARELRYQWFDELLQQPEFSGLLVAHHADDQLETVLLNLLRGTGIEGIYGMSHTRDKIIRPLLPFQRSELEHFALTNDYSWREDSSNKTVDYKRNFIRHQVIPRLQDFDPSADSLLQYSFDRIKDTGKAFFYLYETWLEKNVQKEGEFQYLEIEKIKHAAGKRSLLFYWLRTYGFNYFQMEDLIQALEFQEPGKSFLSKSFALNLDRDHLILGPLVDEYPENFIHASDIEIHVGQKYYELMVLEGEFQVDRLPSNAMLDRERLDFPLKIRQWRPGDRFRPLGMKKFKKVSDFLTDLKIPLIHKRNIKVLCSGDDIVWIIGFRIDDRYKLTPLTKKVFYLKQVK